MVDGHTRLSTLLHTSLQPDVRERHGPGPRPTSPPQVHRAFKVLFFPQYCHRLSSHWLIPLSPSLLCPGGLDLVPFFNIHNLSLFISTDRLLQTMVYTDSSTSPRCSPSLQPTAVFRAPTPLKCSCQRYPWPTW